MTPDVRKTAAKQLYLARKHAGLCVRCVQPSRPGRIRCKSCSESGMIRYANRRDLCLKHYGGQCRLCSEASYCFLNIDHIDGGGIKHRKEMGGGGDRIYAWLIRNNMPIGFQILCWNCNHKKHLKSYENPLPLLGTRVCRDTKRVQIRDRQTLRVHGQRARQKACIDAMVAYGGAWCVCCKIDDIDLLTLDHIDGGGNKERLQLKRGGTSFYIYLRKNGFPSGYRVLCRNCNSGRHLNGGTCPHMGHRCP